MDSRSDMATLEAITTPPSFTNLTHAIQNACPNRCNGGRLRKS